jgi:hypothetical protein
MPVPARTGKRWKWQAATAVVLAVILGGTLAALRPQARADEADPEPLACVEAQAPDVCIESIDFQSGIDLYDAETETVRPPSSTPEWQKGRTENYPALYVMQGGSGSPISYKLTAQFTLGCCDQSCAVEDGPQAEASDIGELQTSQVRVAAKLSVVGRTPTPNCVTSEDRWIKAIGDFGFDIPAVKVSFANGSGTGEFSLTVPDYVECKTVTFQWKSAR